MPAALFTLEAPRPRPAAPPPPAPPSPPDRRGSRVHATQAHVRLAELPLIRELEECSAFDDCLVLVVERPGVKAVLTSGEFVRVLCGVEGIWQQWLQL